MFICELSQRQPKPFVSYLLLRTVGCGSRKTPPSPIHVIKSKERHFCRKKAPAAARKISPRLKHVIKLQERHCCRKKGTSGCREDFTKPWTCHPRNVIAAEKKAAVAAGKTSPSLRHVIKSQECEFCREKVCLRQPGRPYQA